MSDAPKDAEGSLVRPKRLKRPTADIEAAVKRAARSALSVQIAKSMSRVLKCHFKRVRDPKPPPPKTAKRVRSRVTNGWLLFFTGNATTAEARRFADILGRSFQTWAVSTRRFLRGTRTCAPCGQLERRLRKARTSHLQRDIERGGSAATSGDGWLVSSYAILREAGRALHGVARTKGGDTITAMTARRRRIA